MLQELRNRGGDGQCVQRCIRRVQGTEYLLKPNSELLEKKNETSTGFPLNHTVSDRKPPKWGFTGFQVCDQLSEFVWFFKSKIVPK